MTVDLTAARAALQDGRHRSAELLESSLAAAAGEACRHAFVHTTFGAARATAQAQDRLRAAGVPTPPLAGLAISVKDLFDVQGEVSSAGSVVLADAPPATADCSAVARR